MRNNNTSKAAQSKKVRIILNRYRVDTSAVQVTTSLSNINLYGSLQKYDGSDFTTEAMVAMIDELTKIGAIHSNLDNWDLNGGIRKIER